MHEGVQMYIGCFSILDKLRLEIMYVCMYLAEYLPRIKTLQAAAWDSRNGQPTYPAPYTLQSTSVCVCMYAKQSPNLNIDRVDFQS